MRVSNQPLVVSGGYGGVVITDLHSFTHRRPRCHLDTLFAVGDALVPSRCWTINRADWQPLWQLRAAWPADPHDPTGATLAAVRAATSYRHLGTRPLPLDNPEVLILARGLNSHQLPTAVPCCLEHLTTN